MPQPEEEAGPRDSREAQTQTLPAMLVGGVFAMHEEAMPSAPPAMTASWAELAIPPASPAQALASSQPVPFGAA